MIDIAKKQVVKEIKVGDWPSGIKISKDGKTAYVACSGNMWNTIDVIDTGKMEKVRSIFTSDYGPKDIGHITGWQDDGSNQRHGWLDKQECQLY